MPLRRTLPGSSAEFERGIARGHYHISRTYESDAGRATTPIERAELLIRAASACRRHNSAGIRRSEYLLDEAMKCVASAHKSNLVARIFYERGKNGSLIHNFDEAAQWYRDSADASVDELTYMQAKRSEERDLLMKAAGGADAPEVALSEHGIAQFTKYREDLNQSFLGSKWYVYNLIDLGEYYAAAGESKKSVECLAEAGELIDQLGLKEVRPKLYQNLALAFEARKDWWRYLLAASVSLAVFNEIHRQENKGLTLLIYLKALWKLGLEDFSRVVVHKEKVDREMNNQWALDQVRQLSQ